MGTSIYLIAPVILSLFHHLCKVLHKLSCIYSLLFSTRQDVLQSASVVTPYKVYITYIFAMKCAFNMPLLFSEQFVDGILSFYAFEFLT